MPPRPPAHTVDALSAIGRNVINFQRPEQIRKQLALFAPICATPLSLQSAVEKRRASVDLLTSDADRAPQLKTRVMTPNVTHVAPQFGKDAFNESHWVFRLIAVVCAGLLAGIYLHDRASAAARAGLSASGFVQYQQTVHLTFVRMMPALLLGAVLAGLVWLFLVRSHRRSPEFWLLAAALCGIILIAVMTRLVNVPLNDQLMTWNASSPPANLRELWGPLGTRRHDPHDCSDRCFYHGASCS